jgi:hypothetical protein
MAIQISAKYLSSLVKASCWPHCNAHLSVRLTYVYILECLKCVDLCVSVFRDVANPFCTSLDFHGQRRWIVRNFRQKTIKITCAWMVQAWSLCTGNVLSVIPWTIHAHVILIVFWRKFRTIQRRWPCKSKLVQNGLATWCWITASDIYPINTIRVL